MHRVKAFVDPESLTFVAKFFLVFAVAYAFVVSSAFYFVVGEWKVYAEQSMAAIEKSNHGMATETCDIMGCVYITIDGVTIYRGENNVYTDISPVGEDKIGSLFHSVVVIPIQSRNKDVTFGMSISNLITFYFNIILILYVFLMVLSLIFLIRYLIRSSIKSLVDGASNTASIHNKNMAMLAEQLHHELNTQLSVVKELCDKVFLNMQDAATCTTDKNDHSPCKDCTMPKRHAEMVAYKRIINNNIKQAFVFIERMADVKQIRYSNGNKNIYDIVKATFDIMGVYNRSNYTYDIDDSFKRFRLDHASGLQNHELMNILVNHIKNSLEAGSSHIVVSLNKVVLHKMSRSDMIISRAIHCLGKYNISGISPLGIVVLYRFLSNKGRHNTTIARMALIDNGSGIPKEFQDKLFSLNASTKNKNGVIRGAGLYLNRNILQESRGDLWMHKTGKSGTTFILDVPSEQISSIKSEKKTV